MIKDNIKRLRKDRHMTQQQLADAIGVHLVTLQSYEAGKYIPKFPVLVKLSSVLGVPVGNLDESLAGDVVSVDGVKYRIDTAYNSLTDEGKEKLADFAEELQNDPKYRK